MKVLFVCQNPVDSFAGGVQHITYELANSFKEIGIESLYLSVNKKEYKGLERNYYIPNVADIKSTENKQFITELLGKNGVDIIINQCGIDFRLSKLIFDAALGRPVITCFHNSLLGGIENFYHLHQSLFRRLKISRKIIESNLIKRIIRAIYIYAHKNGYIKICRKSARVIVLTNSMLSELKVFVRNNDLKNVEVIPNFVSPVNLDKVKEKTIVYVGRIDRLYKQTDLAISIWKNFSERHPDYHFYVVGDGKDLDFIKDLAVKKNCKNIHFEGQNNPDKYYKRASLLMFTSCSESFGLVLIEAMAYGIVPIAFDSYSAIREIIDDGIDGCLVEPFNITQFSNTLSLLVEDKKRYDQMSTNAIAKARIFSKDIIIEKWLTIMKTVK